MDYFIKHLQKPNSFNVYCGNGSAHVHRTFTESIVTCDLCLKSKKIEIMDSKTRYTRTQNRLFMNSLTKKIIKLGAIPNTTEWLKEYPFTLQTQGGLLYLKVDDQNDNLYTLWAQFQDIDKAKEVGILPQSKMNAKMNFHIVKNYKDAIKEIIEDLTRIL
jgi:hypothetical protein